MNQEKILKFKKKNVNKKKKKNNLVTILEELQHLQGHKDIDFAWHEVAAVTMNGVQKNICPPFFHDFCSFETVKEESQRSSATW